MYFPPVIVEFSLENFSKSLSFMPLSFAYFSTFLEEVLMNSDIKNVNTIIVGGNDRGVDLTELINFLKEQDTIENVICLPKTGEYIEQGLKDSGKNVVFMENFKEVVKYAMKVTKKNTSCILSPAASSYGYFKNFEERGRLFKEYIMDFASNNSQTWQN